MIRYWIARNTEIGDGEVIARCAWLLSHTASFVIWVLYELGENMYILGFCPKNQRHIKSL